MHPTYKKLVQPLEKLGIQPHTTWQFLRFNAAGLINGPFFLLMYELFYYWDLHLEYRAAFAWALAYIFGSIEAHFVHYKFTFKSQRSYLPSLWRTLLVYVTALILSTYSDHILVTDYELHHRLAWFINASFFGIFNFMALRIFAFMDTHPPSASPETDAAL